MVVPNAVARYLGRLSREGKRLSVQKRSEEEPKSFGVFLGSFVHPPTASQTRLLSKWDVLVLDPLQDGVLDALSMAGQPSSTHILGRIDVRTLGNVDASTGTLSTSSDEVIRVLGTLAQTLGTKFKSPGDMPMPFTGVLLANCQTYLQPVVLNETAKYINSLGLDLWLEIDASPMACLTQRQCRDINMELVMGLIYRNGTIRPDGDRQNYFQMAEMRTAMRAVAAQRTRSLMMMWETVDDGVEQQYAVVQRTFNWCRFNNALCWIGSTSALTDANAAAVHTVDDKPLGALMWLKNEDVMKAHDVWRANDQVRTNCPLPLGAIPYTIVLYSTRALMRGAG